MRKARHRWLYAAAAVLIAATSGSGRAQAEDTIKIGVLHSLSGTMAISETILKDLMLMEVAEINAKGGLLGKKIEPVVVDPAARQEQGSGRVRLLDVGVPQIGSAGVRGTQRAVVLSARI